MANILLIGLLLLVSARGQEQEQGQQCKEQEFAQIRSNYESCASKKIREITSWLQAEEDEGEVKEDEKEKLKEDEGEEEVERR